MDSYEVRKWYGIPVILLLVIGVHEICQGQSYITRQKGIPFSTHFPTESYPGSSQNWDVAEDSSGYLYFGNSAGLLIYKGDSWEMLHLPDHSTVRALHTATDGTVYLGSKNLVATVGSDSLGKPILKPLTTEIDSTYGDFEIFQIQELNNTIYFQSYKYIFTWDGNEFGVIRSDHDFSELRVVGDRLQVRLKGVGLYDLIDGELHFVEGSEIFADESIFLNTMYGSDQIIDTWSNGLWKYSGSGFTPYEFAGGEYLHTHNVYRDERLNETELALATLSGGVMVLSEFGNRYQTFTRENGLTSNVTYSLFLDSERNLSITGDDGLVTLQVHSPLSKLSEGLSGIVTDIDEDNETLFVGTTSGLFIARQAYGSQFGLHAHPEIGEHVNSVVPTPEGVLVATNRGIYVLPREGPAFLLYEGDHRVIEPDPNKMETYLVGGVGSIFELTHSGNGWSKQVLFETDQVPADIVLHDGDLWFGSSDGITRLKRNGDPVQVFQPAGTEDHNQMDRLNGELFVGTNTGMFVYDSREDQFVMQAKFEDPDLRETQVKSFIQCSQDDIWIRSNRKIKRFRRNSETGEWQLLENRYNQIDEGNTTDVFHCGSDGDMWFGGSTGVYHLADPDWTYSHNFRTNITSMAIRSDSVIYGGFGDSENVAAIPYQDNEFRFTYAAASYVAPEETVYRTRLRGYDDDWSPWTPETQKDYTFVPEGSYVFEVQGRNIYNKMGSVASFPIHILPPWYRTIWAYLGYILLAGGLLYGLHRVRINRIMKEQRIRNRIASDLHDEVSATLSSISYFAQAIRQTSNGHPSGRFVDLITESATDAKEKITDIIWSVDPENDSWVNLLSKCRRFASDLLESKGIAYDLEIATDIPRPLPLETRQHLWLIFKEMVTNAARHSGATEVRIRFLYENGAVRLVIQDNGNGWDTDTVVKGNGIKNIQSRAAQLDGDLELETDETVGTRWTMRLEC